MIMGLTGAQLQDLEVLVRARLALYTPGQPMAIELSKNPTVLVVNDTVFAHGGLLPEHVEYGIETINAEVAAWMRADEEDDGSHAPPPFQALGCVSPHRIGHRPSSRTIHSTLCYSAVSSDSAALLGRRLVTDNVSHWHSFETETLLQQC